MTTQGYREANSIGLQCLVDQCQILGQMESNIFRRILSSKLTSLEGLSHPQSHPPKGHKKVSKEEERPKKKVPSQPQRSLTQAKKKSKGSRGHFPTLRQKTKTQDKNKTPRPREVEMLQELLLFLPRSVVFTNEEMSSLYRILEGLG